MQFFGIFPAGELRDRDTLTPWAAELEQKVFQSNVGVGPYSEVAFFHKKTRTLLVTDAVISVPRDPPEVRDCPSLRPSLTGGDDAHPKVALLLTPPPLPAHGTAQLVAPENLISAAASNFFIKVLQPELADVPVGDVPLKPRELTRAVRDLGWQRMALQILYIVPGDLRLPFRCDCSAGRAFPSAAETG